MRIAYSRTVNTPVINPKRVYFTSAAHQTWIHKKKFRQANGSTYFKNKFPRTSDVTFKGYLFDLK
jgi:hypothetical protein